LAELKEHDDIEDLVGRADSALYEARDDPDQNPREWRKKRSPRR
jgi:hypothetical protein